MMSNVFQLTCAWALVLGAAVAPARAEFLLNDSDRVILFGDTSLSETYLVESIDQFLRSKHLCVRDRTTNVVRNESRIELVVLACRVAQHAFIERQAFFPEPAHDSAACSSGDRALTSSTTSVPVPSFVNTSSRMLSGSL